MKTSHSDQPRLFTLVGHPDSPTVVAAPPPQPSAAEVGAARRDLGIDRASRGSAEWVNRATTTLTTIVSHLDRGTLITSDDLWDALARSNTPQPTGDPRAMGAVFRTVARRGRIINTMSVRQSTRSACNCRPITIWRIL